ncbi:MAG: 16S rRNA (uracil(1498)-N(3))-methyltransferase [Hyphomonadaceae bacterium]
MSATPRLYVSHDLAEGGLIELGSDQAHYLSHVLRLNEGAPVRVFNETAGEFAGVIAQQSKRAVQIRLDERLRLVAPVPDVWLLFAPLKRAATDLVIEKATELGIRAILPVLTERCEAQSVRTDRFRKIALEAAEQTERLDIPEIREAARLDAVLADWPAERLLIYCDESGDDGQRPWGGDTGRAPPLATVLAGLGDAPAAILIGPEGGFTPGERAALRAKPYVRPVGLGPRILRGETAAIASLAVFQAVAGDWR